jgi:hypothetical protein
MQRVVVSDLLQCVGVVASGWLRIRISNWCRGWASPVRSVVAMVEGGGCSALDFNSLILIYLFDNIIQ